MSVTGTQVIAQLDGIFNDAANAKWSAAQKLTFVNSAIDAAWGFGIKNQKVDSSRTLAVGTLEYSPTATPELEDGFAEAYVVPNSTSTELKTRLRGVRQRISTTTFTILVPSKSVALYNGNVLHLYYNSRVPRITALTDTIELPIDFLTNYTSFIAMTSASAAGANFDARVFQQQIQLWYELSQKSASANRRGYISKLPITYETGSQASADDPTYTGTVVL